MKTGNASLKNLSPYSQ